MPCGVRARRVCSSRNSSTTSSGSTSGVSAGRAGPIHDAVTIAHLIDPTLVSTLAMNVQIETESPLCLGRTVADRWAVTGLEPNASVGLGIDRDRFVTMLLDHISALP